MSAFCAGFHACYSGYSHHQNVKNPEKLFNHLHFVIFTTLILKETPHKKIIF